jgi:uncharacterized protein YcaQ
VLRIDRDEARRIAVRAALLDAARPADLTDLVRRLAALRVELTTIVAPAHDHVAWSRLGREHHPDDIPRMLAAGVLFERNWYLRPMSDLGLFLAGMRTWGHRSGFDTWIDANDHFRRAILDRIADTGPLTSREIPDEAAVPWQSSGWTRDQNVTRMLDGLHGRGELAVRAHDGRFRVWDLAENVYPSDIREVPREEAVRVRSERLLAASGLLREVTATWPGELHNMQIVGEPVEIDGVPGRWRVDPAQLDRPFVGRTAILSPFDRLVFARERVEALFGFEYAIEMYKPAHSRRWGPFGLPILHGDRLVGKVDARADRKAGVLGVNAIHEDEPFTPAIRDAVRTELEGLSAFLGLRLA